MLRFSSIYSDASSKASTSKLPHWPDAILGIKPKGLLLPGAGGKVGKAGDAALGYASAKPFPIWCVLEEIAHPEQSRIAARAMEAAFEIAATNGCQSIGLWLDHRTATLMEADQLASIALGTFMRFPGKHCFSSFHVFRAGTASPGDEPAVE